MAIDINTLSSLGAKVVDGQQATTGKKRNELGQAEFLKLMTTQMTHQDPMKPMENGEFLSQMAQFGTVSGIQDLQKSFKEFAGAISSDQALQAAGLVGRYVSVPANEGVLPAGGEIKGQVDLPASAQNINVVIQNATNGEVVRNISLGGYPAGKVPFIWDGLDESGQFADPGLYKIRVDVPLDGVNTSLQPQIISKVESVSLASGGQGVQVNLNGMGAVAFNQIKQIL